MGTALWLFGALPEWYFSTLGVIFVPRPLSRGFVDPLIVVPFVGTVTLVWGLFLALIRRRRRALLMVVPLALCHLWVALAGSLRGSLANGPALWITAAFLLAQAVIILAVFVREEAGERLPSGLLGTFAMSYAFFAAFVGGMAWTNSWL